MIDIAASKLQGGGKWLADLDIGDKFTINEEIYEKVGEGKGRYVVTGEIQKFFKFTIIDGGETWQNEKR